MIDSVTIRSLLNNETIEIGKDGNQNFWLEDVDWGQAEGSHSTYSMANQQGETIVATSMLSRPISITGWVIEDSTPLLNRCRFLNQFISPTQDYILEYSGYKIQFRPDSSIVYGRDYTVNNVKMRQFLIQGTCPSPFFTSATETVALFDLSTKQFRFPNDFGSTAPIIFATTELLYNTRINNPGGFSVGVTIQIDFTGPVTNPRVKDLKTNNLIGVNRSFTNGERLTIVTVPGQKSMILRHEDQKEENVIKNRHIETVWLQLAPGSNVWSLDCDDLQQRANMNVQITFSPLYLEVE